MNYNKLNLTLTAVLIIALFFNLPQYHHWLWDNILNPNTSIQLQAAHLGETERMNARYGFSYKIYKNIEAAFKAHPSQTKNIVLLPPNGLLRQEKVKEYQSKEPSEFYYYTGCEAVWATSPDAEKATWAVYVAGNNIFTGKLKGKPQLDSLLAEYRKYNYAL
jgi:hypothetical protein